MGSLRWLCGLGLHRWVLYPPELSKDAGESPYFCARCGAEPLTRP